ncbi:hypothetical protein F4820DRAFT_442209 [Hypoxylon rubiginosum]|uniref:Uncharacterized protein n=1 Tax=Hypoxylon rubiginosum TaxID=110542 RepID=A0ACB9YGQ8_9PEZI|nr:hypothetical protein F4820DRAFT_442209 [Hypoxylon rubiginosum]
MIQSIRLSSVLLISNIVNIAFGAAFAHVARDGLTPSLSYDPNTTSYCTWWVDLTTTVSCTSLLSDNLITLDTFRRWNPSITAGCGNLLVGHSYCVEAFFEPITTTTTITSKPSSTTSTPATTTTKVPNGIETPTPTQPNIVDNCDEFYYVKTGDSCANIASSHGITLAQFLQWNPNAGSTCGGLWADAYACVSVLGTGPSPTSTQPGNGVATPTPTQDGMVSNCNKFHFVYNGQTCATIAALYSISVAQFVQWNPAAKSDCSGLWGSTYACVGVIGTTPTPSVTTTTSVGNGIATPTPTQPSMVNNCDSFYYVASGDYCASIASKSGISLAQFVEWNPSVGSSCTGLWLDAYVCISIIGHTPTSKSPGTV